jgi:hypothetical protein
MIVLLPNDYEFSRLLDKVPFDIASENPYRLSASPSY